MLLAQVNRVVLAVQAAAPRRGGSSNNWVLSGSRTQGGEPILASDPHVPFAAVSMWHEVHLLSDSFNVAGIAYVGVPAIMIGRNETRRPGALPTIFCSVRDLYQEQTSAEHPGCFSSKASGNKRRNALNRL